MDERAGSGRMRDAMIRFAGGVTLNELDDRVKKAAAMAATEAYKTAFTEAAEMSGSDEPPLVDSAGRPIGSGYRQIVQTPRDLSGISQERAIDAAYRLWNTNPLGKALTEIKLDYVLGAGPQIQAEAPEVKEAVEDFWNDPVNDLEGEGTETMVRELGLFGEQVFLAFVRDGSDAGFVADGRLRLGPVDPKQIAAIITHPKNRKDVRALRLKSETGAIDDGPIYKVIRRESADGDLEGKRDYEAYKALVDKVNAVRAEGHEARFSESILGKLGIDRRLVEGQEWLFVEDDKGKAELKKGDSIEGIEYDGECFLFQVNKISTGVRGRPDLLPLIDWLDRYDQLFFDGAEHAALLNTFVWDLEVEDGSELAPELEQNLRFQASKIQNAAPNSVYAHNQKTKLLAVNPKLQSGDLGEMVRALRVFISGGERIPEHWIAEGGYTNRATAKEMGQPTFRMLTRRQAFVKRMLTEICQYQVEILVSLGQLQPEYPLVDDQGEALTGDDGKPMTVKARDAFEIIMPDINVEDTVAASQALMNVANAAFRLNTAGLLPAKVAVELVAAVANAFGVEIDVDKVMEEIEGDMGANKALADLLSQVDKDTDDANQEPEEEEEPEAEPA
ncbi:MAG: hypothetical protein KAJ01_06630 [Candidatus Hydrogenedentes bacterium]|nr:hypothetical protein [Candidatus Hydrogenedentota bacterium]